MVRLYLLGREGVWRYVAKYLIEQGGRSANFPDSEGELGPPHVFTLTLLLRAHASILRVSLVNQRFLNDRRYVMAVPSAQIYDEKELTEPLRMTLTVVSA